MRLTILEFIGGAWDGMNLCTDSPDTVEVGLAVHVLKATGGGRQGMAVRMPLEYARARGGCHYRVADRTEAGSQFLVRLECCGDGDAEGLAPHSKSIALQFVGGCLDGCTLQSDVSALEEALLATALYCLTDRGAISNDLQVMPALCRWFQCKLPCARRSVKYRVVKRVEDEQSITVFFEHPEEA